MILILIQPILNRFVLKQTQWHVCSYGDCVQFSSSHPQSLSVRSLGQRSELKEYGYSYSLSALAMVLLGLWYQDANHVLWFSTVSICFLFYSKYLKFVPANQLSLSIDSLLLVVTLGSQLVLPQGPAASMLIYVFISTLLIFAKTLRRGFFMSALGLCLILGLPLLGVEYPIETNVPAWSSFVLSLVCSVVALFVKFSRTRQTVSQAMESLAKMERSIEQEMIELTDRNRRLAEGNRSLERGTLFLRDTLKSEAFSTSKLSAKRNDQKSITNAIHHDMREPLRGIVSFSQLIQRRLSTRPEAEGVQDYLGFAIDGGQRMAKMLDDLLMYSKNNNSELPKPLDMMRLLSEVKEDLFDLIDRSNATIQLESIPDITGFETQIKQLFQNLLSNALKFSKKEVAPVVCVRPSKEQAEIDRFVIEISDNGVGIPANQIDKIFGLFNRAHEADSYEGSGVGLALCRRIAIAHAANLTVESTPGEGTTFFLSLPKTALVSAVDEVPSALFNNEMVIDE